MYVFIRAIKKREKVQELHIISLKYNFKGIFIIQLPEPF